MMWDPFGVGSFTPTESNIRFPDQSVGSIVGRESDKSVKFITEKSPKTGFLPPKKWF